MRVVKEILCWLMGAFYVGAGISHFVNPAFFVAIVPPHLPWKEGLVVVSGIAEIILGVAVVLRPTRRWAAWGIIALLVAVFPANIFMAAYQVHPATAPEWMRNPSPMQLWFRLPLQGVLALWAYWYARPAAASR
jgi:uncharacterized membrane protein